MLGLSGGIDSAVTLAVAADALGPDRIEAVMMPFRYTASMSIEDAEAEAHALGVGFSNISIEPCMSRLWTHYRLSLTARAKYYGRESAGTLPWRIAHVDLEQEELTGSDYR